MHILHIYLTPSKITFIHFLPGRSRLHSIRILMQISVATTDFLSFVPPRLRPRPFLSAAPRTSCGWQTLSTGHVPALSGDATTSPPLPDFTSPSSPSLHLFCLGQFGPGGAPLQNRAWSILGKPGLLIAWLRFGRSALLATWSSSEHALLPAIVGVVKVLHLHRSSDKSCALKDVRLASFLKQMKT